MGMAWPGQARPGQACPSQAKPGLAWPGQARPRQFFFFASMGTLGLKVVSYSELMSYCHVTTL